MVNWSIASLVTMDCNKQCLLHSFWFASALFGSIFLRYDFVCAFGLSYTVTLLVPRHSVVMYLYLSILLVVPSNLSGGTYSTISLINLCQAVLLLNICGCNCSLESKTPLQVILIMLVNWEESLRAVH